MWFLGKLDLNFHFRARAPTRVMTISTAQLSCFFWLLASSTSVLPFRLHKASSFRHLFLNDLWCLRFSSSQRTPINAFRQPSIYICSADVHINLFFLYVHLLQCTPILFMISSSLIMFLFLKPRKLKLCFSLFLYHWSYFSRVSITQSWRYVSWQCIFLFLLFLFAESQIVCYGIFYAHYLHRIILFRTLCNIDLPATHTFRSSSLCNI